MVPSCIASFLLPILVLVVLLCNATRSVTGWTTISHPSSSSSSSCSSWPLASRRHGIRYYYSPGTTSTTTTTIITTATWNNRFSRSSSSSLDLTTTPTSEDHHHHQQDDPSMQEISSSAFSSEGHNREDIALFGSDHRRRRMMLQFLLSSFAIFPANVELGRGRDGRPLQQHVLLPSAQAAYIDPTTQSPTITDRVYLDVQWTMPSSSSSSSPSVQTGRIVIGLYGDVMPRTVENFVTLCRRNAYAGTTFYRIVSEYSIQGGAIGDKTISSSSSTPSSSGTTGRSAFGVDGAIFEPDNYDVKHTQRGLVSMVRATNAGGADSRFFIQLRDDAGWADDRYAAFGIVLEDGSSHQIVETLERQPVQPPRNNPKTPVHIIASGVL